MPWTCKTCFLDVAADNLRSCPNCGVEKLDMSVDVDTTNAITIRTKRRVEFRKGEGNQPLPSSGSYAKVTTAETERVIVVPKSRAREYVAGEKLPPPDQVFFARLFPDKWANKPEKLGVTFTPESSKRPDWTEEFEQTDAPTLTAERFDRRFFFVYGEGDVDFSFPGLDVVDLTDEGSAGYTTQVGVVALKKKERVFLVDPLEKGWCQRLECKQIQFNHDSHLLLPEGLAVIALALEESLAHPGRKLLITGHTDATGEDTGYDNDGLSDRRTNNVRLMLEGDRMGWATSALANRQHLIGEGDRAKADRDADTVREWLSYPDYETFAKKQLVSATSWDELEPWEKVFDNYERELRQSVTEFMTPELIAKIDAARARTRNPPITLKEARRKVYDDEYQIWAKGVKAKLAKQRAAVGWVDPELKSLGCGAQFLKIKTQAKNKVNRRVEFLWFDPQGVLPWTAAEGTPEIDAARVAVYGEPKSWDYLRSDGPFTFDRVDCPPESVLSTEGNVLFVVDISGSMRGEVPGTGRTRLQLCRAQLLEALDGLAHNQKFNVFTFDTNVGTNYLDGDVLHPASRRNVYRARYRVLMDMSPTGSTATHAALEHAIDHFSGVDTVVFLSDGCPTVGNLHERKILDDVKTWRRRKPKTKIETFGFVTTAAELSVTPEQEAKAIAALERDYWSKDLATDIDTKRPLLVAAAIEAGLPDPDGDGKQTPVTVLNQLVLGWLMDKLASENGGHFTDLARIFAVP